MKTSSILKISIVIIFCCYSVVSADSRKDDSRKKDATKSHYTHGQNDHRDNHKERFDAHAKGRSDSRVAQGHDRHSGPEHRYDYHTHRGYREHPHDRGRHYGRYAYRGHDYDYHGHWSSWAQWHDYAQAHPQIREHGHYYREGGHLMFRFLDPLSGGFFFFSIGR
jgi:hypothetical protein